MRICHNAAKARSYLGKRITIGLIVTDHEDNLLERRQIHGEIIRIGKQEGLVIRLDESAQECVLPPDLSALLIGPSGATRRPDHLQRLPDA